jgi:uncharacterized protein (DUF4415 family)
MKTRRGDIAQLTLEPGQYDFSKAKRGAIEKLSPGKTRVTIRPDNEILEWFRAEVEDKGAGSYQKMINDALHGRIGKKGEPLTLSFSGERIAVVRGSPP